MQFQDGQLLRIFIAESDQYKNTPLYEWIVRKARADGLAGATILRGLEGFGLHSHMHTAKILSLSQDLPIVIEIIDTKEKIRSFLSTLENIVIDSLVTIEDLQIKFPKSKNNNI